MSGNTLAHGWPLSVNQREAAIRIFNFALSSDAWKFFAVFASTLLLLYVLCGAKFVDAEGAKKPARMNSFRRALRAQGFKLKIGHIETETIGQQKLLNHEPAQLNSHGTSE